MVPQNNENWLSTFYLSYKTFIFILAHLIPLFFISSFIKWHNSLLKYCKIQCMPCSDCNVFWSPYMTNVKRDKTHKLLLFSRTVTQLLKIIVNETEWDYLPWINFMVSIKISGWGWLPWIYFIINAYKIFVSLEPFFF